METRDFKKCCQAMEEGEEIYVEKIGTHEKGRVLFCHGNELDVRVGNTRETWSAASCEEIASSSESPHSNL